MADPRHTQQIFGYVFLGLMVIFLIMAVSEFSGDATLILIISAIAFLAVGLALLGTGGSGTATDNGGSQQQSVVLAGGRVITQGNGGVRHGCSACGANVPGSAKFCPQCGAGVGS